MSLAYPTLNNKAARNGTHEAPHELVRGFLLDRWTHAPPELYVLVWTMKGDTKLSYWLQVANLSALNLSAFARPQAGNVYMGVGLSPTDNGPHKRCKADDVGAIAGVWADVDVRGPTHKRDDLPPTVEDALAVVDALGVEPTEIIDSGGGLQPWWLFDAPWVLTDGEDRQRARDLVKGWQTALQAQAARRGWHVDNTTDLARVLRVPGTWNCKPELPEPLPVRVLRSGGPRHTVEELRAALDKSRVSSTHQTNGKAPKGKPFPGRTGDPVAAYVQAAFRKELDLVRQARENDRNNTLNRAGFALGRLLHANVFSRQEAEEALTDAALAVGLPEGETAATVRSGLDAGAQDPRDLSEVGTNRTPHPRGSDDGSYFQERYGPTFRRGNAISTRDGEVVPMNVACAVPTSELIDQLARADDAPLFKGGGVNRNALPGHFRSWAKVAWGDLLAGLPDEDTAGLGADCPAGEEFRRLVREAMFTEVVLGDVYKDGNITNTERRSLIEWAHRFAKPGPWRAVRSKQCWARCREGEGGELVLVVAIRHELFAQLHADKRLRDMGAKRFARLASRYGVGHADERERPHGRRAIILDADYTADLIAGLPDPAEE
jgi:hypothetical protein